MEGKVSYLVIVSRHPSEEDKSPPVMTKMGHY